ncbi:MAG: tRNA (adenosine(37)-N6)-threonylcarbamoyltransferase complex ATPase subunit type 1 TsaE [Treponema sp.]|jgi:tRNA threonylcarbamoyladenosine biosynthesis protein TsaE|nr:tRNA (adenosine(37)-N6)-threonylcarbamoyltransferase complex ATPase subunit type 1 TsaE [Treponema sp.]
MNWTPPGPSLAEISTASPEETEALGERIAGDLRPGSVLALRGVLGAGKTCLARGIARALGVAEAVTSPTYTIVSEYEARPALQSEDDPLTCPLYHIDAYRLAGEDDFEALGGRELLYGGGICLIEWSERIESALPPGTIRVEIEITGEHTRIIRISGGNDPR